MEWFRRFGIILFIFCMLGCVTSRPAIILYPLPELDMSDDIVIEDYMERTLIFSKELRALYDELVSQVKIKFGDKRLVDLREDM